VPRLDYRRLLAEAVDLPAVFHATLTPEQLRAELTRMKAGR
jgi:hypothetical protein